MLPHILAIVPSTAVIIADVAAILLLSTPVWNLLSSQKLTAYIEMRRRLLKRPISFAGCDVAVVAA